MKGPKIILTGAHGTGKTTILNMLKESGVPIVTEVVRSLNREKGIKINEIGDAEGQMAIFQAYCEKLTGDAYISDRGLTDVIAYTKFLVDQGKIPASVLEDQLAQLNKRMEEDSDVFYFYFPIEFKIEDDNVRSTDPKFQQCIDENIKWVMDEVGIIYFPVSGTPEERLKQILDIAPNI